MTDAITILVREHEIIEEVLGSLETFVEALGTQPDRERKAVRNYAYFFKEFVDTCHHGKEEDYLFPKMHSFGFSKDPGPVSAMLSEQDEGRDHLNALISVGRGEGSLNQEEVKLVRGHALGYISRIRAHMSREEEILFPIVAHSLPEFVLSELGQDFEEFDKNDLSAGFHEKIRKVSKNLLAVYPPKRSRLQEGSAH
jgi:hemerythrin-like domain-containing protein